MRRDEHAAELACHLRMLNQHGMETMRNTLRIAIVFGTLLAVFGNSGPARAGSQCFKNVDPRDIYISLRYQSGRTVDLQLKPGEQRRFDDVQPGDYYCYSSSPFGKACPHRQPVKLASCSSPKLR